MGKGFEIGLCCIAAFLNVTDSYARDSEYWTGFYIGSKMGAALEQFNTSTSVQPNPYINAAQAQVINNSGNQLLKSNGFLSGIEGGYNWQFNPILLGFETDIQSLSNSSIVNSNAILYPDGSGNQYVINSYASNNWLLTLKPRVGLVTPYGLAYATGGLGLTYLQSDFLLSSDISGFESQRVNTAKAGYVVGGGVETGLTEHLSLKAEYLYEHYAPTQAYLMNQLIPTGDNISNSVDLSGNLITLGVNYHFQNTMPSWLQDSELWRISHWETTMGARLFVSSGSVGAPQPLLNSSDLGDLLASRLTFSHLTAVSEEAYARFDHSNGMFVKGFLGAGTVIDGKLNDEDFPAENAYSNTLSNAQGNLAYGVIDLGYSFLKTPSGKTGVFVGYNYNAQTIKVYNCSQLAGDVVCDNPAQFSNLLGLSENDSFNSLRLGLSSQYRITPQLTFSPEVAYLPIVNFNGMDRHNARQLLGPEHSNHGDGTMLESTLDYQLTPSWSLGIGGRYWAWNMHNGSVLFDFIGDPDVISEPARFPTSRYGGFLEVNYRHPEVPTLDVNHKPMHWTGIFIGGNVGSAWGSSTWSDPFGATEGAAGYVNVAGFGDHISSSGPLGGGNLTLNWETDRGVYGVAGSISAADIRGENTLFSGLGGINGQTKINYLSTIVGRVGRILNESLIYVNAGTAVMNTQYNLTGNTGALILGNESQTLNTWGWTIGAGLDYAFNDRWISSVEYVYLGFPNRAVSFPNMALINEQNLTLSQSVNLVKVSVNYKLGWPT